MLKSVKTLKEVRKEIQEQLGVQKKLNPKNGYYFYANGKREYGMHDTKVESTMCHKDDHGLILAHFKSKKGYNSKLKNNKNFANHYAEYIAYLILKQLGKKVCKVDLGEIEIKNKYSNKIINIEGVLSQYEVTLEENFKELMVIVDSYKEEHPKKYKEMTTRGKTDSKDNYVNIEIILNTLEEYYKKNGQSDKIPQMRKEFFDMCMFDMIFANRDRSDDNFGVKVNQVTNEINFYPLFDNEQILGMQEEKADIVRYLSSEKEYQKFKKENLTSCIGIPGNPKKIEPTTLLKYLLEYYYEETMDSLNDIGRYTYQDLEEVLEVCPGLSEEHKAFAKKIYLERQQEINNTIKDFEQTKQEEHLKKDDDLLEL